MNILFISKNKHWCNLITNKFEGIENIKISHSNILDIPKENHIFVTPSNSLVRMEGGIDLIMSRKIFPGIHKKVDKIVKKLGIMTLKGQHSLPVGSSLYVEHPDILNSGLIVSPTMFCSSNVSHTQNAYISFLSSLILFNKLKGINENWEDKILVVTSHCCGNGNMSEEESVNQFYKAYQDFQNQNYPKEIEINEIEGIERDSLCLLPYEEEEITYEIDENDIKTIKIMSQYTIKNEE